MKNAAFTILVLSALSSSAAFAASEVVAPSESRTDVEPSYMSNDLQSGAYIEPALKFARVTGTSGVLAGARGGWVLNHDFVIGAGVYGIVNNIPSLGIATATNNLDYVYGGLLLEYIIASESRVHLAVSTLIGGGGIGARTVNFNGPADSKFANRSATSFVAEPELDAIVNITQNIHTGLGVSYRMNRGTDVAGLNNSDLSGTNVNLFMQFGAF